MERRNISSGTRFEAIAGYSRAVVVGPYVYVAGTTATDERGNVVGVGDIYAQTIQTLNNIRRALDAAGATLEDVVRTRIYVTNISYWEAVGRAHGEFFGDVRPVSTLVEVNHLVVPTMMVEIEADAILNTTRTDMIPD